MRIRTISLAVVAGALVLALAGCGGTDSADDGQTGAAAPPAAGAAIPGGGLTVAEAMATTAAGPLQVKGFLVRVGDDLRLCTTRGGGYAPPCGEPSLKVAGYQGDAGTEQVSLLGDVDDGVLTIDLTVRAAG